MNNQTFIEINCYHGVTIIKTQIHHIRNKQTYKSHVFYFIPTKCAIDGFFFVSGVQSKTFRWMYSFIKRSSSHISPFVDVLGFVPSTLCLVCLYMFLFLKRTNQKRKIARTRRRTPAKLAASIAVGKLSSGCMVVLMV